MKHLFLNEEVKFAIKLISFILLIPLIIFSINYLIANNSKLSNQPVKEKTVIITETAKKSSSPKTPPAVPTTNKESNPHQEDDSSTLYMQIKKNTPESAAHDNSQPREFSNKEKQNFNPSITKEKIAGQDQLIYYDETTPRDKSNDWIFVYFINNGAMFSPRFCIQLVTTKSLNIRGFKIIADETKFEINFPTLKTEESHGKIVERYDAPVDYNLYSIILALTKAGHASLIYDGSRGSRERDISDTEIKGINRIMDVYTSLGGTFSFLPPKLKN